MGSLIEYFKLKTAASVLEKSISHAEKVQECVRELNVGIKLLIKDKKIEEAQQKFKSVDNIEREADELRRKIQKEISSGELSSSVRMDLSHLIKRQDGVADCATGVARRINTIPLKFWEECSEESKSIILEMMEKTEKCVGYLDKIVMDLLADRKNVKDYAREINFIEHEIDLLNIALRKSFQETEFSVNAFTIFTVGNTTDIIEAISDAIEGVADYILRLLTSSKPV
ncbi:MAG: DUF47 domain-containing protein [Promethearchaeota archaeon]